MKGTKTASLILSLMLLMWHSGTSYGQQESTLGITPDQLYEKMSGNPAFAENAKGEGFCWHARSGMDQFVDNYELTKNTAWLDAGVRYYDFVISKMDVGPDGYKGWIGPYMYDKKYWIDSHVGDAILLNGMLDFALLVSEDKDLKSKYGAKAKAYTEIAKKDLIEKNDKRETWREDGPIGGYVSYERYMEPGNLKEWKYGSEVIKSGLSHPFNKQNDLGQVCLQIYRLTGEKFYRDRAEKIFLRMKRQLQLTDNHYEWNYWEPFGPWDVKLEKNDFSHWVGINPSAGYQAREVAQMVDAYHTGVVFDETDIKRLINTHLDVMWNKDKENPAFTNSYITHGIEKENPKNSKATGTLWTSLLDFDQRIRDLYAARFDEEDLQSAAYLRFVNVISKNPPSFKRKYAKEPVKLPVVDKSDSKEIRMAIVIPAIIKKGEQCIVANTSWSKEEMEVALYSADGKNKLTTLRKSANQKNIIEWDGKDPETKKHYKGDFRIRWTQAGGYREYPITIK
ncbi:MAG: hypothetical protein WEB30_09495 [Cyclobacteriaceae bacterium]